MDKISHNGNFSTKTDFRLECGTKIRIDVWYVTEYTISNRGTYYKCNVSKKNKWCRNWEYLFSSISSTDERILRLISKEQLYTAYYNHWIKLNPIRLFSNGCTNGEYIKFDVKEKEQEKRHFAY